MLSKNKSESKIDPKTEKTLHGEVRYSFQTPEFIDYQRGTMWYLVAGIGSLSVIAFGVVTQAITFVIAYLLLVAVYFLMHHQQADLIEVAITQHGIRYGEKFFSYGEIQKFWLIWKPPYVADLKLHIKRKFQPVVTIHIFGQDPIALRELLRPYVEEVTDRDESFSDLLIRSLRL